MEFRNFGWMIIPIKAGIYDLLVLQNNVSVLLADNVKIPEGKITQLRLLLGDRNTIVDQNGVFPLKIPSGAETGLKINIHQTIDKRDHLEILLDFDANESVEAKGNGEYSLRPVIRVKSITYH